MPQPSDIPRLRLVRPDRETLPARARLSERERACAAENRQAATLGPGDARWVLAVRVAESLDGGPAGVLAPEKRRRLTRLATSLGLRPFDASLIIAIVQDGVRSGEGALGRPVADRLTLVTSDRDAEPVQNHSILLHLAAALLLGLAFAAVLIRWVTGG